MARTTSTSCWQITITTRERRTSSRSISPMPHTSGRDDEKSKFESCCGRLECMS